MLRSTLLIVFSASLVACSDNADDNNVETAAQTDTGESTPGLCLDFGPQTPRDISSSNGVNAVLFERAPAPTELNLCNIHTHTNAEHKAPGFSVFVNDSDSGGYACNGTTELTDAELSPLDGAFKGAKPGDTIEVHWVHSSCAVSPGEGLGSCLTESCENPLLRVEAQAFLLVNDPSAADFAEFAYDGTIRGGLHQAKSLPSGTGQAVEFLGSTTGPSFNQSNCSPMEVTWNVRPQCMKLDMASLHRWAENGNIFNETKSHGVRQLVTAPELLAPIEQ